MREKENIERMMHRPSINETSHLRQKELSIGEHLYLISKKPKPEPEGGRHHERVQAGKKSKRVYEERKELVFEQIFRMLDSDQDGAISNNALALSALPHEVVKIIYPLVEELELMEV
jgi:hypothetical protein